MNRALYLVVVVCFAVVTTASFFFGKFVLGEKLLNKPNIQTQHYPGEQSNDKTTSPSKPFASGDAFSTAPRSRSSPRVVIEVKPGPPKRASADTSEPTKDESTHSASSMRDRPYRSTTGSGASEGDAAAANPSPEKANSTHSAKVEEGDAARTRPPKKKSPRSHPRADEEHLPPPHADDMTATTEERTPVTRPAADGTRAKTPKAAAKLAGAEPAPITRDGTVRVQVGLFSARENADARAAELQKRGYPVATVAEERDGQKVYRVQVGPFKNKETATKVKKELADQGFEGFVPQ